MRITKYKNTFFADKNERKCTFSGQILNNPNINLKYGAEHSIEWAASFVIMQQ
jgi:hypothetical protein